jgi:glutathione S-transferase
MKLHYSPTSPYVRKVMILLHETETLDSVTLLPAGGLPTDPGKMSLAANPLSKVPALERDEGCTLYDSRVICRYLAAHSPQGAAFYPPAPALWEVLTLEATADGMVDAALLIRYEVTLREPAHQLDAWTEGQWQKVARGLQALESRWMAHLQGPISIGNVAVACALGYLDFRFAERDWRGGHPVLAEWFDRFSERPSMQATIPA